MTCWTEQAAVATCSRAEKEATSATPIQKIEPEVVSAASSIRPSLFLDPTRSLPHSGCGLDALLAVSLSQHPDKHRPQRPVLLAVDQEVSQRGGGPRDQSPSEGGSV